MTEPTFASSGKEDDTIEVLLSYDIVRLFSEGLYQSPSKTVEELVSNSFDAGAKRAYVVLSPDLRSPDATIAVVDDGDGMNKEGLRRHWRIGYSNKLQLRKPPRGRKQIGQFGIGKLSTYVLANRLTHISKQGTKYYSVSMDYRKMGKRVGSGVTSEKPIRIPLRVLTKEQAKYAVEHWAKPAGFDVDKMPLFGENSPRTWTISIVSDLKPKAREMTRGRLRWVLRTALPLQPDFSIWLDSEKLESSRAELVPFKRWIIGKDIVDLPRPGPNDATQYEDQELPESSEHRFGLNIPELGKVTGCAEAYENPLTGKPGMLGRNNGFFVRIHDRLIDLDNDHFGIPSNMLRHGTFSRFRLVIHMDGLNTELRSTREAVSEGPKLEAARNVLQAIFNKVRSAIEKHDQEEEPEAKLVRRLAASPAGLSRGPIVDLARAVAERKAKARFIIVPCHTSPEDREEFLAALEQKAQKAEDFLTDIKISYDGTSSDGMVKFDTGSGILQLNGRHPFITTFYDRVTIKAADEPLNLFAMAEVLVEAYLYSIGIGADDMYDFLLTRDQLLRDLANESGRMSALSVASELSDARNNSTRLEECVCNAFTILGFGARAIGGRDEPDGVATASLSPDDGGPPREYKVSLEAKSKEDPNGRVGAKDVDISGIIRHRDKYDCDHAIVVCQKFATEKGDNSALGKSIGDDRENTVAKNKPRTITLMELDDLVELLRLWPEKRPPLQKIRELFKCRLPDECKAWVESIRNTHVERLRYGEIIATIAKLQARSKKTAVKYAALHTELFHLDPPIEYETESEVKEICAAMARMAPNSVRVTGETVYLEQSAENAIDDMASTQQYVSGRWQ